MIRVASVVFANKTEKQKVARDLHFGWFIEDQRSNANLLAEVCRVFLINKPYNQAALAPKVQRIKSLSSAIDSLVQDVAHDETMLEEKELRHIANAS